MIDKKKIKEQLLSVKQKVADLPNGGISMVVGISNIASTLDQIINEIDC